jgi:hypothetical protein
MVNNIGGTIVFLTVPQILVTFFYSLSSLKYLFWSVIPILFNLKLFNFQISIFSHRGCTIVKGSNTNIFSLINDS